jgi:hypothetical protein
MRRPDYADQLGFTAEADKDIRCLTNVLTAQEDSALAVFVDDLDRCSPKHVIEVVEAINQIFNSSADSRCVFFLGMDSEVVAASVDVAYSEMIDYLKTQDSALASGYGYQFLTKIIQMSLSIPVPDRATMRLLLADLTGNEAPVQESKPTELSEEEIRHFEARIEDRQPVNPADVAMAEQGVRAVGELSESQQRALEEAARRARAKLFGVDSPDVVGAEFEILGYLSPNPRQIKRFDNAFRLQLHVANSSGISELSFRRSQLVALGKWIALRLRWPDLAAAIDSEPRLLAALEDNANNLSAATIDEAMDAEMKVRYSRWFDDSGLKSILEDADPERRIMYLLRLTTLLRVA